MDCLVIMDAERDGLVGCEGQNSIDGSLKQAVASHYYCFGIYILSVLFVREYCLMGVCTREYYCL